MYRIFLLCGLTIGLTPAIATAQTPTNAYSSPRGAQVTLAPGTNAVGELPTVAEASLFVEPASHSKTWLGEAEPVCCADTANGHCGCDRVTQAWTKAKGGLAQHGVVYAGALTQFYQGVASGGGEQHFKYSGKLDQFVILNFGAMGLSDRLTGVIHAETSFGETVIADAALLAPVNANMLYPALNESETAITGLLFEWALTEEWAVSLGKFNALDFYTMLFPISGRGVDGFMNVSNILPLNMGRTVPLSFLGTGITKRKDGQIQGGLVVYDSQNSATTSGFDEAFDNGVNILGMWRFFSELGGRPGSHSFVGSYATGQFTTLDPLGWAIIPDQGIVAGDESGSWHLTYLYEQQLWADCCNERRVDMLAALGYADPQTSPYEWVANLQLYATGLLACRAQDQAGLGFFYSGLSSEYKSLLAAILPQRDLQGVEVFYRAQLTPTFHLTADLQVVEPAAQARNTAVVVGLRGKLDF